MDLNLRQIETVKRAAIELVLQHTTPRTTTLLFLRQLVLREIFRKCRETISSTAENTTDCFSELVIPQCVDDWIQE